MRIKVCGLTRLDDALQAAALGADALGFVLWPESPRAITLPHLRLIVEQLPPFVTVVGVCVAPTTDDLRQARAAGIHVAQVHGECPVVPDGLAVLPAAHLAAAGDEIEPLVPGSGAVLLDAHDPVRRGGTGRTIDWARAARVARTRSVILAGGLTPDNVGEAIGVVRPYGVDVASGVEAEPGVKDHHKLAAFIAAVRAHA